MFSVAITKISVRITEFSFGRYSIARTEVVFVWLHDISGIMYVQVYLTKCRETYVKIKFNNRKRAICRHVFYLFTEMFSVIFAVFGFSRNWLRLSLIKRFTYVPECYAQGYLNLHLISTVMLRSEPTTYVLIGVILPHALRLPL